jgi:hypothetical protein
MNQDEVSRKVLARYKQLCAKREVWRTVYGLLAKYILMRPLSFGDANSLGSSPKLSVADVSDDEVIDAARTSATALGGALWPNTAESFELVPLEDMYDASGVDFTYQTEEVKQYVAEVTRRVRSAIDSPESRFQIAWSEYLDEQVVFGTGGIYGEENLTNDEAPFKFRSASIENCVIDENADGVVDTVYFESAFTARQLVDKYGKENVSDHVKGLYDSDNDSEYIKVVQALEPRPGGKVGEPVTEKPYASIHVECNSGKVLKNSGADEMSAFMVRFRKRATELYGRGLGLDALPTIREINILRKAYSLTLGKINDPPLGFYHDMIGGAGQVNLSMGARVPLYATGKIPQGQSPVVNLLPLQEPQFMGNRIDSLVARVAVKFLVDRLLDFNNKTRMTLGEAQFRMDIRNQALGNIFSRQIIELLYPMVKWAVVVMMRRKLLGLHPQQDANQIEAMRFFGMKPLVIPQPIANLMSSGKFPFAINFISPAARAMRADSLQGLQQLTNYVFSWVNAGRPDAVDNFDVDGSIREYQNLSGGPIAVVRGKDEVEKIRRDRSKAQMRAQQLAEAEQQSAVEKNSAKAAKDYSQAGMPPGGMGGMSFAG